MERSVLVVQLYPQTYMVLECRLVRDSGARDVRRETSAVARRVLETNRM